MKTLKRAFVLKFKEREVPHVADLRRIDSVGGISVSIVSHGQGAMVQQLVEQVLACPEVDQIVVTQNIPENHLCFPDSRVELVRNSAPKGFGANHNAAFLRSTGQFWCVLNPDVALIGNPFTELLKALSEDSVGLVAPLVTNRFGRIEDNIRRFPSLTFLALKVIGKDAGRYVVGPDSVSFQPEWVAGMFMLFRADAFAALNGFDEGFFLYYEDVDICVRAWKAGIRILANPLVSVVHDARRDSHRNAKYLRLHLASMARFFWKHWGRLPTAEFMYYGPDSKL